MSLDRPVIKYFLQEGPLIHIGSIIGGVIAQGAQKIKIPWLEQKVTQLNNSREKRDLIAAGFAAGVAAAFSSPVGKITSIDLEPSPGQIFGTE